MKSKTALILLFSLITMHIRCDSQTKKSKAEIEPKTIPSGMVMIPSGTFMMGSDGPQARPDEGPVHSVKVEGFWIDQTEVTNAQFADFVSATGYITTAEKPSVWR